MTIPEAIGAVVLFTTLSIMLLCTIKGVHSVSIYQFMLMLMITVAAILLLAYCFDPKPIIRFDLAEHFKLLDKMRSEGWTYAIKHSEYGKLYVTLAYFWLIAETGLNHLFPLLPMLTEFIVVIYIIYDLFYEKRDYMIDISNASFTLYIWFCTYGFLLALSGVRCSWAMAIATGALYRDCVKEKRDLLTLIGYIMPLFIHYFAFIVVIIRLMLIVKHKAVATLFMIGAVKFGPQLAIMIYRSVSISYVRTMMAMIIRYWSGFSVLTHLIYSDTLPRLIYLGYICAILFALYMTYRLGKMSGSLSEKELRILELGRATSYLAIVVLFNYLFIERYMYVLSYILAMLMPVYLKHIKKSTNEFLIHTAVAGVLFLLLFFNNIYLLLVNMTGRYFLTM